MSVNSRYKYLKEEMLYWFDGSALHGANVFCNVFKIMDNNNHIVLNSCEVESGKKTLNLEKKTPASILFNILRLANRKVLLRELYQTIPILFESKKSLIESFTILYSLELVDFTIKKEDWKTDIKDCIYLFFKDDFEEKENDEKENENGRNT